MERVRQRGPDDGYLGLNLLRDVPVNHVRGLADRFVSFSQSRSVGLTEKEQMDFFKAIQYPRFLEIREAINGAHLDDCFHFWTAEMEGLDAFLTMDRRFWRAIEQNKERVNSPTSVLTPKQLCEKFSEPPMDIEELAANINPYG